MKRGIFFSLAVVLLFGLRALLADTASKGLPHLDFTDNRLDNGLRLILVPDHSAPVLAINVTYDVGSRNEGLGRTGFAHLFEHMMFEGSENVAKGEHFMLLENNGGDFNGATNEDRTTYFEIVPKNQLDLILFLESDRMGKLAVTQEKLDNQRNAVQEERRLSNDNQPYGKSYLEIDNLAYDCFGYKHPTVGSMADLNAANLDDIKDFFRMYYAPSNAVLTLVGDFNSAEATEKIKKYFGGISRQPNPPPAPVCEEERYGERRETLMDPLARLPALFISYQISPGNTPDNYAAHVLGDILGTGQSSRIYQHVVKDKQLATQVEVQVDSKRGISSFYILAYPCPGAKLEDLEAGIYDEINAIANDGVSEQEMDKARTLFRRQMVQGRESALTTAIRIGEYAVYFNDPDLINTITARYDAVTADEVKSVARKYLITSGRTVVITLPGKKPAPPAAQPGDQP